MLRFHVTDLCASVFIDRIFIARLIIDHAEVFGYSYTCSLCIGIWHFALKQVLSKKVNQDSKSIVNCFN